MPVPKSKNKKKVSSKSGVQIERWMIKHWGKRCEDFEATCPLCRAWASYDYILQDYKYNPKNFVSQTHRIINLCRNKKYKELKSLLDELSPLTKDDQK